MYVYVNVCSACVRSNCTGLGTGCATYWYPNGFLFATLGRLPGLPFSARASPTKLTLY